MSTKPVGPEARHRRVASPMRVVFVLVPRVHLLDLAGPAQVFGTASELTDHPWQLTYVAESPTVTSHQGLPLAAELDWPELGIDDIVIVPGWRVDKANDVPTDDPSRLGETMLGKIAEHHRGGGTVMSVCAGAFALADAGVLDGRRATTHHELQDDLARRYPAIRVARDVLYVSDGNVHTSAGIASGIDLALHIIALRLGDRGAAKVARAMVVYSRRNGHEPQSSVLLGYRDHVDELVHQTMDIIDDNYTESLTLAMLARQVGASQRTLTRAFARSVGLTPLRYQQSLRLEHAERLIAAGTTIETAARSVGFDDARMLRTLRRRAPERA